VRTLGAGGTALALVAGCVSRPGPTSNPLSTTTESIVVALQSGCLPYLVEGGSIHQRLRAANSSRGGKLNGKPADRIFGAGDVEIQEDPRGGWYMAVEGAMPNTGVEDAARFRQAVLDLIPRIAGPLVVRFDSGPGFNDPIGRQRQESYCFDLRGRPAWLLVTTRSEVMVKAQMQVSIGVDHEDICKGKVAGVPQGGKS
jgi:hypothetical protein